MLNQTLALNIPTNNNKDVTSSPIHVTWKKQTNKNHGEVWNSESYARRYTHKQFHWPRRCQVQFSSMFRRDREILSPFAELRHGQGGVIFGIETRHLFTRDLFFPTTSGWDDEAPMFSYDIWNIEKQDFFKLAAKPSEDHLSLNHCFYFHEICKG